MLMDSLENRDDEAKLMESSKCIKRSRLMKVHVANAGSSTGFRYFRWNFHSSTETASTPGP